MASFAKTPLGERLEGVLYPELPFEYWMRQFVERADRAWLHHNARNPFSGRSLLWEAWEHGRRAAHEGQDVGACPHQIPGDDGRAVERMEQRSAWFQGHRVGSVQQTLGARA